MAEEEEELPFPWWEGYGCYLLEWPDGSRERRRVRSASAAARLDAAVEEEGAEATFMGEGWAL